MIQRLRLMNYKGFEDFTLHFRETSFLIGPNNAGKSTIIGALRLCAVLLSHAKRRKSEVARHDTRRDRKVVAYSVSRPAAPGFVDENIRYEFRDVEARIELHFKNKAALYVVWPSDDEGYFYVEHVEGAQPPHLKVVKDWYSTLAVVQTLAPIEHREVLLTETYIRENLGSPLASRHFRNQLFYRKREDPDGYNDLCEYLVANTPEIESIELVPRLVGAPPELDLFFQESGTRTEKELYWAGDGLQIWLQILFHIWRQSGVSTLILDEPDVFLHPDLQRRLVHVLEDLKCQVILATHAPEILAEASRDSVVMVDRTKRRSRRVHDDRVMAELNDVLGSGFNLRLSKALRSRVALFVEGQDMRILKNLARTVGANLVSQERGLTVVPMGGASNRRLASSFGWINTTLLDSAVKVCVVMDRDYLTDSAVDELIKEFASAGVSAHIWARKELESYLLATTALARLSGLPLEDVDKILAETVDSLRDKVLSRHLASKIEEEKGSGKNDITTYDECLKSFNRAWSDREWRLASVPAKDVLSGVNTRIQEAGGKAVSARNLSSRMLSHEIPIEMREFLVRINEMLA